METDARQVSIRIVQRGCGGFIDSENADTHRETPANDQVSASRVKVQTDFSGLRRIALLSKKIRIHTASVRLFSIFRGPGDATAIAART